MATNHRERILIAYNNIERLRKPTHDKKTLCFKVNISCDAYRKYKRKTRRISLHRVKEFARALDVHPCEIILSEEELYSSLSSLIQEYGISPDESEHIPLAEISSHSPFDLRKILQGEGVTLSAIVRKMDYNTTVMSLSRYRDRPDNMPVSIFLSLLAYSPQKDLIW